MLKDWSRIILETSHGLDMAGGDPGAKQNKARTRGHFPQQSTVLLSACGAVRYVLQQPFH